MYWVKLSQTQDQGLQLWKTKFNAIVVDDRVPAHCIYRVTSLRREHTLYEKVPTPRLVTKVILKSRWSVEQEQDSEEACTDAWKKWKGTQSPKAGEDMKIETLDEQCETGCWKQHADTDASKFEVDLRIPGVPDEAVQQYENYMKEINEKNWEIKNGTERRVNKKK